MRALVFSPLWCKVVHLNSESVGMAKQQAPTPRAASPTKRMSVTFPSDLHRTLEQIAAQQKVSVAWVVRDAAEKYVSDRWPLLAHKG